MKLVYIILGLLLLSLPLQASKNTESLRHHDRVEGVFSKRSSLGFVGYKKKRNLQCLDKGIHFDLYHIEPDGDCAFSGLHVKREKGVQLLINHLEDPFVQHNVYELMHDHFQKLKGPLQTPEWRETVEALSSDEVCQAAVDARKNFCRERNNQTVFLEQFYIKDRNWLGYYKDRPRAKVTSCFDALAHILRCRLVIYTDAADVGHVKCVHDFTPKEHDETIYLLHVNGNHFERLVPTKSSPHAQKKTSNLFDLLRILEASVKQ